MLEPRSLLLLTEYLNLNRDTLNLVLKKLFRYYPLIIVLILFYSYSYLFYKDFGITADEKRRYNMGQNYASLILGREKIDKNIFKDHFPLYEGIMRLLIPQKKYENFHLFNLIFASLIIIGSYILFFKEYKDKFLALIPPVLIILTPRFFGDMPANPKDMPFAVMYFLSISVLYIFNKQNKSFFKLMLLGLLFGIAQSMRIIGYTLYILYLLDLFFKFKKITTKDIKDLLIVTLVSHLTMFITWPYLHLGISKLFDVFYLSKNFDQWDNKILYLGNFLTKDQRPWHYLFLWLLISSPIYILTMHSISLLWIKKDNLLKIFISAIYLNLLAYLVLNPVIYNGIRHFLYLLPLISATAAIMVIKTIHFKLSKLAFIIYLIFIVYQLFQLHPFEYIYFNPISRRVFNIENTFETDYWGATYKDASIFAVNYIKENKLRDIKVYPCSMDFAVEIYSEDKLKLKEEPKEAQMILCDSEEDLYINNDRKIIYEVKRAGMSLNKIRFDKKLLIH